MLSESLSWASAGVRLRGHTFYRDRAQFITTEGAFPSWVLIVPETGAFDYEVEGETGEIKFGELVVAPPDGAFWRCVKSAALTYHVLQWSFGEAADFPTGKSRIEDSARLLSDMALLRPLLGKRDPFRGGASKVCWKICCFWRGKRAKRARQRKTRRCARPRVCCEKKPENRFR